MPIGAAIRYQFGKERSDELTIVNNRTPAVVHNAAVFRWRIVVEISEAMHRNADWVSTETSVADIAKLLKKNDIGAVPVQENDKLVGIITDRDLVLRVTAEGRDPEKTSAKEVMSQNVIYCETHQTVEDAIHLMDQKKIRRLPVMDESKQVVGMLTVGDISHSVSRELVGELMHAVSDHHS